MFQYLTYTEYQELGGTVSIEMFPSLNRKAQQLLDYITFNRIPQCWDNADDLPLYIKSTMTDFVDQINYLNSQIKDNRVITKYSNGVEDLTYDVTNSSTIYTQLNQEAIQNLPTFLTTRVVNFDVTKYIQ